MDAVRPFSLYLATFLAVGCQSNSASDIGRNSTIQNSFPNGNFSRSQAPEDPPVQEIIPAAGSIPLKKNEAQVRVVASIGTESVITDEEVWHMVKQKPEQYAMLAGAARTAKEQELFRSELKQLIARELVIADFTAKIKKNKPAALDELRDLAKKEADRNFRMLKTNLKLKSDDEVAQFLGQLGVKEAALRRQYERNILVDIFVGQTIRDKVKALGLAELRDYYDQHTEEFRNKDRCKWLCLTVLTSRFKTPGEAKQYADWLSGQAAGGADFVGLVKQYGMGDSKLRDGEGIGEKRGEIQPKELETAVFALTKEGEVSKPIPVATGYHILKCVERDVAGLRPFDEKVQTECRNKMAGVIQKQEVDRLTDELWRKYRPQIIGVP
ncbi:MAG: peptidyl-prolyl cis-trans isomerase [Gemmataceae bacterium]